MRKPVILFLLRFHSLKRGSFEESLIYRAEKLKSEFKLVYVFAKFPPSWLYKSLREFDASVDHLDLKTNLRSLFLLNKLLHKYKPKIIHFHFFSLLTPFIPYIKFKYKIKVIFHIHAIISYDKGSNFLSSRLIPFRKYIAVRTIDLAIAVSKFVRQRTLEHFSFPHPKIVTIYNGIKNNSKKEKIKKFQIIDSVENSRFLIVAGGWLTNIKGIDILLKSIPLVKNNTIKDIIVFIVGDGPERNNLKNLCSELELEKNIEFLGWRNDVHNILALADLVVIPSVVEEAFCYFLLEAMRTGKAVIASNIGAIPELVDSKQKSGLLFPPGDIKKLAECIMFLLNNPILRKKYGHFGMQKSIKYFNINSQILKLKHNYQNFLKNRV